jgi:hypothetical protein
LHLAGMYLLSARKMVRFYYSHVLLTLRKPGHSFLSWTLGNNSSLFFSAPAYYHSRDAHAATITSIKWAQADDGILKFATASKDHSLRVFKLKC